MRDKGFTLIELLAVIVILAIVALIATPLIMGIIEKAQTSAYEASLRGIFEATDLYVASDKFNGFPDEGIAIVDDSIKLKNKEFTSGKIIKNEEGQLVLQDISNGVYCGSGTINDLVVVKGNCYSADTTPPTDVSIGSSTVTSNSITIVADAIDVESAISGYEFSKDDGSTWTSIQTSNVYTFTGLTNNTNYTFKIRATNNNDLTTESSSLTVSTNNIPLPTYAISTTDWTDSAVVTITYPERKEGYVYEYSLDGASTWEEVTSPSISKDITFTDNGSVIARISDGVNEVSATSYDVANIDTTAPVITVNPTEVTVFVGDTYTDSGVTATDAEIGDVTSDIVVTGSVNTSIEGTYTLTYNVSDAAGHAATEVTRIVNVIQGTYTFSYTGNSQTWIVPATGIYKLEVWGGQGGYGYNGGYKGPGGLGGYAYGNINLSNGESLNIYVAGAGGNGTSSSAGGGGFGYGYGGRGGNEYGTYYGGGGGGASAVVVDGNFKVIAGGGGGGSYYDTARGGGGGGTIGINGYHGNNTNNNTYPCPTSRCGGTAGTSTGPGLGGASDNGPAGSPGNGRNGGNGGACAGGGGGGYYGGGGGGACNGGGGGGGSGYIGGLTNASNQSNVRSGNGYAKITFVSQ